MSVKVKSFWATRGESISKKFGDTVISRDIKLGMTVESDSGDRSEDMHISIIKALNVAFEKEREDWMNDDVMKAEVALLEQIKPDLDDEGNPVIKKHEERKHTVRRPPDGGTERESTGDTDVGEF